MTNPTPDTTGPGTDSGEEAYLTAEGYVEHLRLQAFATNSIADRQAYFNATSKWFQERHYRAPTSPVSVSEAAAVPEVAELIRAAQEVSNCTFNPVTMRDLALRAALEALATPPTDPARGEG